MYKKIARFLAVGLLVAGLSACDSSSDNNMGQTVSLLDGKVTFNLPAELSDQSGKMGNQANNMHVYANNTGDKAVIVILGEGTNEKLDVLTNRLAEQQRARDANLQVVTNKTININGQPFQQLDSIITSSGQKAYSSIVMGTVGNQLMTLQITLPAENQQQAQTEAESIISTLKLK
ncbi:DcrB family lipoprotein [Yersinia similis]|uniref:Inner membrane lipoprotein DcrB n=1 Tax=Yersinia similis TaxID=367190 RepID=A0A0T9PYX1_9GAMM|nr:DcrB family lipoprotein [Yersinia similis]AHK19449.1 lipoprotein [Yersinia similis]CFQ55477.1 periplasmic protein%3B required for phage C1 adsorption [Yersinia similis]CNB39632.1 periplasmic protein%3B required for phage C1 adsorption [Yersinia similis]CNE73009.1 periplasmic protein%3B required for phage C1 adsorption [Yersinia similis]CNF78316.1 periplasmic protein%3B required for phage C1 adsorption [Yersinia similis]